MNIFNITISFLLFVISYGQKYIHLNQTFHLNDYAINKKINFEKLEKQLKKDEPVEEIYLQSIIVSQNGLKKLLSMDLKTLKVLRFNGIIFNQNMAQYLFSHPILKQLQKLAVQSCNLRDEDLLEIEESESNIKILSLTQNYLTQPGFQRLSRIKFNQLQSLNVSENSLVSPSSVDHLISLNLKNLVQFKVRKTAIPQKSLLKALKELDPNKFVNLSIGQNDYSPQFYKSLAQFKFEHLELLEMQSLLIDEDGMKYLKDWKLPNLRILNLRDNFFKTKEAKQFINKKNMPLMNVLQTDLNFLDVEFIKHLANEKFVFEKFFLQYINISPEVLSEFVKMDMSNLTYFLFNLATINPEQVKNFLSKGNFSKMKYLAMNNLANAGNLLGELLKVDFPNLQTLDISDYFNEHDIDLTELEDGKVYFPSLKKLIIGSTSFEYENIKQFLMDITIHAPNIERVTLITKNTQLLRDVMHGKYKNARKKFRIQNGDDIYEIEKDKIPYLILGNFQGLIKQFYEEEKREDEVQKINYYSQLIRYFNLSRIQFIAQNESKVHFMEKYVSNNPECVFENVKKFYLDFSTVNQFQIMSQCQFPSLSFLQLHFRMDKKEVKNFNENVSVIFSKRTFPDVSLLHLTYQKKRPNSDKLIQNLIDFDVYRMTQLQVEDLGIEQKHIKKLSLETKFWKRLQNLKLNGNFILEEKDEQIFKDLQLSYFSLNDIIIKQQLINLCSMNFQSLRQLSLSSDAITDHDFVKFIECKMKESEILFPQLDTLSIDQNYISTKGMEELVNNGLPQLIILNLKRIKDPQLFNTLYRSKISRRLKYFQLTSNYMESIDPQVDKRNTRKLIQMEIQSDSLTDEDYQNLATFDFQSLFLVELIIKNIQECQTLKAILQIIKEVDVIQLIIQQSDSLDASCINPSQYQNILPSKIVITSLSAYSYLRNFIDCLLNPKQELQILAVPFTYVSNAKIIQMVKYSDISKMQVLVLQQNNLTDLSIKPLLNNSFDKLLEMNLMHNPITAQGFSLMQNRTYPELLYLEISENYIGDKGIEYLVTNKFPKLQAILISNTDITGKGLQALNKLDAPELTAIDISNNNLKKDDICKIKPDSFKKLAGIFVYPQITQEDAKEILYHFNHKKSEGKDTMVQIYADLIYLSRENQ